MGKFKTEDLLPVKNDEGNYELLQDEENTSTKMNVTGSWRSRPVGRRLLEDDQIREIRASTAASKHLAEVYGCSHVLIYYIKKNAIYSDVI